MDFPNNNKNTGPASNSPTRARRDGDSISVTSSTVSSRTITHRFIPDSKYTLYSSQTDILQADLLNELHPKGKSISEFIRGGTDICWLDVSGASVGEWRELVALLNIHPLTQEDVEVGDTREKVEIFDNYIFICVRTAERVAFHRPNGNLDEIDSDKKLVGRDYFEGAGTQHAASVLAHPVNLYILVFENHVISVHWHSIEQVRNVLYRLQKDSRIREATPDWVAYALLDDIVDEFMGRSQALQAEADSIDDLVLVLTSTEQHDMLKRIGRARKQIVSIQRQLKPKAEVTRSLLDRFTARIQTSTLLYLRDVQDHLLTMLQNLDHYSTTLDRSHANYLAQINIELAEASNRMNMTVKKISAVAAIIIPLSLVASLWGMNVPVPGQPGTSAKDYPAFVIICLAMALITAVMFFIARRLHWV
jgi:magnesium transporter